MSKKAIIIGAGPAGLTAAYELLNNSDIKPIILEASGYIGGISKTINYKDNRIDIGGHRFFSKSDKIMDWWQNILPLQGKPAKDDILLERYVPLSDLPNAPDPESCEKVMLVRKRLSRIFFLRKFFNYPLSLTWDTLSNLGLPRVVKIVTSYFYASCFPIKPERNLEDFFINRFGRELYETFFKDYTYKVWGVPCSQIKPEWGAQRIKGLSISKTILHAVKHVMNKNDSIYQKEIETSLIQHFLYPKYGPGQLWEEVADQIIRKGGVIKLNHKVIKIVREGTKIKKVIVEKGKAKKLVEYKADYFLSTMPIKDLILNLTPTPDEKVLEVAKGLMYRDFITVGVLLKRLSIKNTTREKSINNIVPDNWIYIQEPEVKLGRIQIFNNWSPYLVSDLNKVWLGLEYFANKGDELWSMSDKKLANLAFEELKKIGFIKNEEDVLDSIVIRTEKAYPAYFGTYDDFHIIRNFIDPIENLFLIGRNGMHRYNNQDHSMLTAMEAVSNIINNVKSKENIWSVNAEQEYHEQK